MKKTLLVITVLSLVALMLSLGAFQQFQNTGKLSAEEWAKLAVEEEHYRLDDDGYLLTHNVVLQYPSQEFLEETETVVRNGVMYGNDDGGYYYEALFEHSLFVEKYDGVHKYIYLSSVAWRDKSEIERSFNNAFGLYADKAGFYCWQIIELDIEELEW